MTPLGSEVRAVIFDVDDVVIDTDRAGALAERSVAEPLAPLLGRDLADQVQAGLSRGYDTLRVQLRQPAGVKTPEFAAIEARIHGWQRGVREDGFEVKIWSRDTLLAVALEDLGVPLRRELITPASDHYWRVCARETRLHEDAIASVAELSARGVAVHLATNSDGFLSYDEAGRTFRYDPGYAAARKIERLALIRGLGLGPPDVSVGDPIGKPKPEFFTKVLRELSAKVGSPIGAGEVIAVGDSLTNDVLPLIGLGAPAGLWLVRADAGREPRVLEADPRVLVAGDLSAVARMI